MDKKREQERGPQSPKVDPGKQNRDIKRDQDAEIPGREPMRRDDGGGAGDTGDIERDGGSRKPGQEGRDRDMTERRPHRDEP